MTRGLDFTVGSVTNREDLVADLFAGDAMLGQINQESGGFEIEVFCHPSGGPWKFRLDELVDVIAAARERLISLRRS